MNTWTELVFLVVSVIEKEINKIMVIYLHTTRAHESNDGEKLYLVYYDIEKSKTFNACDCNYKDDSGNFYRVHEGLDECYEEKDRQSYIKVDDIKQIQEKLIPCTLGFFDAQTKILKYSPEYRTLNPFTDHRDLKDLVVTVQLFPIL